jgi:MtfA peptidase
MLLAFIQNDPRFVKLKIGEAKVLSKKYRQLGYLLKDLIAQTLRIKDRHRKILIKYFSYYRKLSPHLQYAFEEKLAHFMYSKTFTGAGDIVITDKMRVLVSAYSAQLTMGMASYYFKILHKVVIHRSRFYSPFQKKMVAWELRNQDEIHLSWYHLYMGASKDQEGHLYALTVMSNILMQENRLYHQFDLFEDRDEATYLKVKDKADVAHKRTQLYGKEELLNRERFLEASLVKFFTKPRELFNFYPVLFKKIDEALFKETQYS